MNKPRKKQITVKELAKEVRDLRSELAFVRTQYMTTAKQFYEFMNTVPVDMTMEDAKLAIQIIYKNIAEIMANNDKK